MWNDSTSGNVTYETLRQAMRDARQKISGKTGPSAYLMLTPTYEELVTLCEKEYPEIPKRPDLSFLYGVDIEHFGTWIEIVGRYKILKAQGGNPIIVHGGELDG